MSKFLNKRLFNYSVIALFVTALFYFIVLVLNKYGGNQGTLFFYLFVLFVSAYRIGKKDDYRKFWGLNYHLVTYIIYNVIPLLLIAFNIVSNDNLSYVVTVIIGWGSAVLVHFGIWGFVKLYKLGYFSKVANH